MVVTVINMGNRVQREEMTVNPKYQHGMQPAFNIFDIGVTQASISF